MQEGSIRTLLVRTTATTENRTNFSVELGRQENLQQAVKTSSPILQEVASASPPPHSSVAKRLICLGTITSRTPTVSHLLVRNPDYQKRCWELIYAAQNKDKPYKEIPLGKTIYLDPDKEEILWDDKEIVREKTLASDSYRSIAKIEAGKSLSKDETITPNIAKQIADVRSNQPVSESFSPTSRDVPDVSQSLGKVLVKKLRHYIGTPYRRLNCYELVVAGLRKMGIKYGGKDGLQQHLIRRAEAEQLPVNAYLTGDGLIEASGNFIYTKNFTGVRYPAQKAEEIWKEIEPLLEPGLMISFSTVRRGHTGIVARHKGDWTFINSGFMDNDIHSPIKRKQVGEENLKQEISNWLRLAYVRRKPLTINVGRLNRGKIANYQREAAQAVPSTNL